MAMKGITLLTSEEIAKFLDGVDAKELKNPKPETMLYVYELICKLIDIDVGSNLQLVFHGTEFIEDGELHRKSVMVIHLASTLRRILQFVGFKDFKVDDIGNPDPKRTRRILSILISYAQFCSVKNAQIVKYKDLTSEVLEKSADLELKSDELRRKINKKQENLVQRRNAIKDVPSQTTLDELGKKKNEVRQEYEELKNKIMELETAMSNQEVLINQNEEKKQELQRSIVLSPERVQSEIQQQLREIDSAIAEQKTRRDDINTLSRDVQSLLALETTLVECLGNIHGATEAVTRLENLKQQSLEMEKRQQTIRQQLDELPSKLEVVQKKMLMQQKISSKHMSQTRARMEDKKKQDKEKDLTLKKLQADKKQNERQMARLDERENNLTKDIQIEQESIKYIQDKSKEDLLTIQSWLDQEKRSNEEHKAMVKSQLQDVFVKKEW